MRLWLSIPAGAVTFLVFDLQRLGWGAVVAALLVSGVLALAVSRSRSSGPGLIVALTGLLFVVYGLLNLAEGVLFDVIEPGLAPVALVWTLVRSLAAVTVVIAVAGRLGPGPARPSWPNPIRTTGSLLWRLAASVAVFVACYWAAGMIIYPFVRPSYAGLTLPDPGAIFSMQVLRSLGMVAAAYPLLRTLPARRDAVLVLALVLPVFGAVAPLLPANDVMPAFVRLVHGLEMVPYYTLFGVLVAVWFGPGRQDRPATALAEAPAPLLASLDPGPGPRA